MDIRDKMLEELDESYLVYLVKGQIDEKKSLEYKRELPSNSDSSIHKFLSQVSSFANTMGGHIIYGIDAKDGIPTSLKPLQIQIPEDEILRLQEIILRGISPRIQGVEIQSIESESNGHFIIIRVPWSFNAPHMVSRNESSKFYARTSKGKHQLDVDEIRTAFMQSETLIDRMRDFRKIRESLMLCFETPVPMVSGPKLVLQLIPVRSFRIGEQIGVAELVERRELMLPIGTTYCDYIPNFDGYLSFTKEGYDTGYLSRAYTQVFRNGIIESVKSIGFYIDDKWEIEGKDLERWVHEHYDQRYSAVPTRARLK